MNTVRTAHNDGPLSDGQWNKHNVGMYYQRFAITKAADYGDPLAQAKLWVLALGGEIGELANLTKKWIGHSHPLTRDKVKDEISDCLWYVAVLCELIDVKFHIFITEPVLVPTGKTQEVRSLNYCLALQIAHGVAANVALYLEDVLLHNVEKLNARYPQGFSPERSVHRVN